MLGAAVTACGGSFGDLERMRRQPRADAYEATTAFADGKVLQAPPAGTVPRAAADTEPPTLTPALLAEGRERFAIYCAACHGAAGFGGSVVATNMVARRPPSLRSAAVRALAPRQLYAVVTHGFGVMPSYAAELTPRQRWAVVAYVGELQRTPAAGAAAVEDSLRALDIARVDSLRAARDSARARAARDTLAGRDTLAARDSLATTGDAPDGARDDGAPRAGGASRGGTR
ncbi:MAG TPA: cytochrome c [Gemmatimonadaceae bacterium]|nr:cytochrome c [Gemmatimonadaceae bacterium]